MSILEIFQGTLSRVRYIQRLIFSFLICMGVLFLLSLLVEQVHRAGLYDFVVNRIMPAVFAMWGVYLLSVVIRRLRDMRVSLWLSIAVFIFGPMGLGFIAVPRGYSR